MPDRPAAPPTESRRAEPDVGLGDAPADGTRRSPSEREGLAAGLGEVVLVGAGVVIAVLAAEAITDVVPGGRDLLVRTPIAIVVLLVATVWVLWQIARRQGPA